jgi:ComF family protein
MDLPRVSHACPVCAVPVASALPVDVSCAVCQKRPPPFQAAIAALLYEFPVDAGLKALKFGRRLQYGPAFGELLIEQLPRLSQDIDAFLPVPLHWRRQAARGFNQATELSIPLAKYTGLPIIGGVSRSRATSFQSGLSASQRQKNLRNAFVVNTRPRHSHIVIVDDVITTGETTRQLAAALLERGARKVSVLAVARAA